MTNEGRRDKESCAGDHRKRTETPTLLLVVGLRELSTALGGEAKAPESWLRFVVPHVASLWPWRSRNPSMTCSLCGGDCRCMPEPQNAPHASFQPDSDRESLLAKGGAVIGPARFTRWDGEAGSSRPKFVVESDEKPGERLEAMPGHATGDDVELARESVSRAKRRDQQDQADLLASPGDGSWRKEVSERLHRYHARRRPRAPRYPSLRLKFDAPETSWGAPMHEVPVASQAAQSASPQATTRQAVAREYIEAAPPPPAISEPSIVEAPAETPRRRAHESAGKVIEFPRTMYATPAHLHDLAEPILDRPRILEAPEIVPPPPALGGLTIEETQRPEPERRAGIDMPLQTASLEERLLAVAVDAGIVLAAAGVFGTVFYKLTHARLSLQEMVMLGAGLLSVLWASYQYLLIVYSGSTPGLRAFKLRLERFDGKPVSRSVRRWRVLASLLSGISLGMGYAWHFLDEDGLCWHERVSKTHIAPFKS